LLDHKADLGVTWDKHFQACFQPLVQFRTPRVIVQCSQQARTNTSGDARNLNCAFQLAAIN